MACTKPTLPVLLIFLLVMVGIQAHFAEGHDRYHAPPPPSPPPPKHVHSPPPKHMHSPPPPKHSHIPPPPPPCDDLKPPPRLKHSPPPPIHSPPPPSPPPPKHSPPPPPSDPHAPLPPSSNPPPPMHSPPPPPSDPHAPLPPSSSPPPPSSPPVNCIGKGGMCGDPRIIGGDGIMFYFHGHKDQDFCLVSDSDLHINAHFIGKRPEGRRRDFTWVQALGFIFGGHTLSVIVKRVAIWDSSVDQIEFLYDGKPFNMPTGESSSWTSLDKKMTVERLGAKNSVDVRIREKMGVSLNVVPIGKKENEIHRYGITDEDCFAHFDMQFRFYNLSSAVNGVLGQTYQPQYVNPVRRDVVMPIMGHAERFVSSSLLATDCKTSQYTATAIPAGSAMPRFSVKCESSGHGGIPGGITCRR